MDRDEHQDRTTTVAIAGNPNAGKTSIFNALTGARQRVGNYPGVTVEKKEGECFRAGRKIHIVDLPGTYSLQAASLDEKVARDFIVRERPDVVLDVVDASCLERHLSLTSQLVELGVRLVLVLNMSDRARAAGQVIDLAMIRERLGCEVVETVGSREEGIETLVAAISTAAAGELRAIDIDYGNEINTAIDAVLAAIRAGGEGRMQPYADRWVAVKLLEEDPEARRLLWEHHSGATAVAALAGEIKKRIEGHHGDALPVLMAERRYGFAAGLYREVLRCEPIDRQHLSDQIDDILTHRWLGIPLFFLFLYALFSLTFRLGEIPMRWIEEGVSRFGGLVVAHWPGWAGAPLKSLIVSGVIDGVGGVLVFLPTIILLFLGIALMEDTGYMARAAFIMDRLMHRIGLHGKSFIPMMIGFGCSVPAIMATRTLEHRRDRLATMLAIPLMSCGARLTIYSLFIPAFFPEGQRATVLWLVYVIGVVLAVVVVKLLRSTLLRGETTPFVMELPPYRMPTAKGIVIHMWERAKLYLRKAATVILAISIVMWALMSYPKPASYEVDRRIAAGAAVTAEQAAAERRAEGLEHSAAGWIGRAIEPAMQPLGFDWRISTALIGAFAAKEVFVSQLSIVFSLGQSDAQSLSLREELRHRYSPLVGLCVMLFCLIGTPCVATMAVTRREAGGWRWALAQFVGLTVLAYVVTFAVYQIGSW